MISVGYMAKRVTFRPDWVNNGRVSDIYSVSGCISEDFADYIDYWKHNGYWFFDSPQTIIELAQQNSIDLQETRLFYYESYEREFDYAKGQWETFSPEPSFKTDVMKPAEKSLLGYDIVTFSMGGGAECSPLSCNGLADEIDTNEHCLLPSLDHAKALLEAGRFENAEPGPYRIFAVYSVNWF